MPGSKIDMVPHGVPDLPFLDPNFYKDRFGVEGKAVLLTFGLLSPNKGIENVIQAMPQILSKHENVVYLVAGATHPHILRREGDKYRDSLQALAKEVGVESQVIFHDRFVSPEEMAEFIGAADIYITPYRHEAQVVSGTLAYALGAGKAIISTPYWHAIELLDDGRGALVPFQNPDAIAQKTIELLTTPALRHAMRKRAYLFARDMVWKKAAQGYMESFARVRSDRMETPRVQFSARATREIAESAARIKTQSRECADRRYRNAAARDLHHPQPRRGIYHRRQCARPDFYSAAGATGATTQRTMTSLRKSSRQSGLAFPLHGIPGARLQSKEEKVPKLPGLRPSLAWKSRDRKILTAARCGLSELSWARSANQGLRGAAGRLFEFSVPAVVEFHSPRACAYALLGIQEYLHSYPGDRDAQRVRSRLAQRLLEMYESIRRPDWKWFEDVVAYGNARLPQAMLLVGSACGDERMLSAGLDSLEWLMETQRCPTNGHFVPDRLAGVLSPGR